MGQHLSEARPSAGGDSPTAAKRLLAGAGHRFLQLLNAASRRLADDGRFLVKLEREALLEKSRRLTGLEDFGGSDFLEPLGILLRSLEEDAELNLVGRITAHSETLRLLCNRLQMQADRQSFPAIAEVEIRRPIFITGLPRSGTTFLHALLARDPASRAPEVWEVMHPSPPPESARYRFDPRIRRTRRELGWIDLLMPGFDRYHTIEARLPQECISMTDHSFLSYLFESMYYVTSYRSWHDLQDKRPAYEFHRRFLQQLQWRCPGDYWVLKAPCHLMTLDSLFQVYPDAQIIMTHRNPLQVIPSSASLMKLLRGPFTGPIDPKAVGEEVTRRWGESVRLADEFRCRRKELQGQFYDVSYRDLLRDPMSVVSGIYRHLGRDLGRKAEEEMRLFIASHPKDRRGAHLYSLEQFGLDPEKVRGEFRGYIGRFDLASDC